MDQLDIIKKKTKEILKELEPCVSLYKESFSGKEENIELTNLTSDRLIAHEVKRILGFLMTKEQISDKTLDVIIDLLSEILSDVKFTRDSLTQTIQDHIQLHKELTGLPENIETPLALKITRYFDVQIIDDRSDLVSSYLFQLANLIVKSDDKVTEAEEKFLTSYNLLLQKSKSSPYKTTNDLIQDIANIYNDFFTNTKVSGTKTELPKTDNITHSTDTSKVEDKKNVQPEKDKSLEELLADLNKLTGLSKVKEEISTMINTVKVENLRKEKGLPIPEKSRHIVFTGNPGTGKTTIARLLSKIYKAIGVLEKGHLIETDRTGLVAGYVGQTAIKTIEIAKSALGGILFIDEAYSLSEGGENDFGKEAINTLLKFMEDNRANLIVIVAGYTDNMEEFINKNPGLKSRFNKYIHFEDYNPDELMNIFELFLNKSKMKLTEPAKEKLYKQFQSAYEKRDKQFGNGRFARNLFENIYTNQANRIVKITDLNEEILSTLTEEDIGDLNV